MSARAVDVFERNRVGRGGRTTRDGVRSQAGRVEHRYVIYELRGSRPDRRAAVDRRRLRRPGRTHRSARPAPRPRAARVRPRALGPARRGRRTGHGRARGRRRCRCHASSTWRWPSRRSVAGSRPRRWSSTRSTTRLLARVGVAPRRAPRRQPHRDPRAAAADATASRASSRPGAVADVVVALRRRRPRRRRQRLPGEHVPNLASAPLADRDLADAADPACSGALAERLYDQALDEWRALTASALVGLGLGALDIGVRYVSEREQFGVPIGSFQAMQHTLADVSVALDGAQLLARKAAWAHDAGLRRRGRARRDGVPVRRRAVAAGVRPRAALPRRLRVHGGVRHPALLPAGQGLGERARRAGARVRAARRPALRTDSPSAAPVGG